MIVRVALRSLAARPIRSAVLATGFGLGVGVMVTLLGVGDVILRQARAPALAGGGDVVIGSASGRLANAAFVLYTLRPGGPFQGVQALSPTARDTMYLRHDGRAVPIVVRSGIPSAERQLGAVETRAIAGWTDTAADRAWLAADPGQVLRSIDRFHAIPAVPARAASWAEWLYFNGTANGTRFYLTFMSGRERSAGQREVGVRLQLERGGVMSAYSSGAVAASADLVKDAPDLTFGLNSVRLVGTDYRISLDLPAETGHASVVGTLVVRGDPARAVPPFVLQGAGGWISGYVVPVTVGALDGELRVGDTTIALSGGRAYHDHNWGFWDGVSWQWGQVQGEGLSFVYGRVRPPADAADPEHVPGFLGVLGPDGPLAFSTDAAIDETNGSGTGQPSRIVVRARNDGVDATLTLDVAQTTVTRGREGRGLGGTLDFLQMRATCSVKARVGSRVYDFAAPASAETFRER
ncbi:MAG TPA: hypothetical protein VGI12_08040 [Vicinamibacterales bacterium]